jgi:hypothetical protein
VQWLFELPDPVRVIADLNRLDALYTRQQKPDFPLTLVVRRDDVALCKLLLASGAKAENN